MFLVFDTTKCELLLLFAATQYKHETLTQFSTNVAENRKKVMGIPFIFYFCSELSPAVAAAFAAIEVVGLLNAAVAAFLLLFALYVLPFFFKSQPQHLEKKYFMHGNIFPLPNISVLFRDLEI